MGASKPAFDTIVASGARSALPHASPQPIALERNSPIVVDQGAILDDYVSDMTRLVCLGRLSSRQRLLFRAVREAQQAAIDAVKAGVKAHSVDRKARQVLKKFKLDQAFSHSTGHGIGLEIHEQPRIGLQESVRLANGMVITIEPGAYVEGVGGVRIEDVVVVTSTGCEVLTRTPRHVRVL
jgi:Xaa-Pro aminopeptidase